MEIEEIKIRLNQADISETMSEYKWYISMNKPFNLYYYDIILDGIYYVKFDRNGYPLSKPLQYKQNTWTTYILEDCL